MPGPDPKLATVVLKKIVLSGVTVYLAIAAAKNIW